jgi:UDP-N-acetylglucosamine--N-acetylmuramyl-(pentapeptide) pyrophosphoryl-undecaprenol N-acetylglucosamine transferase
VAASAVPQPWAARAAHEWGTADAATALADAVLAMLDGGRAARTDHTDPVKTDPKQTDPSLTDHDQSHNARRSAAGASAKGAAE